MRRSGVIRFLIAACVVAALIGAGCGGGGGGKKSGGTLTMLTNGDVDDALDPGYSYYQLDFIYNYAVERPVISYKPDDVEKASPDLASEYPTVSEDGKTVTIKLKKGIRFAPPVNREVEAKDVKYALERDFLPQVGNGYAGAYWGDLIGSDEYAKGKADEISGLTTPDKYTLVMKLSRPTGTVGNRRIINGQSLIGNPTDLSPTPAFLKQNLNRKDNVVPGVFTGRVRYV